MSDRTYLQLVKAFVSELGIQGGSGPTTVVGQQGELKNACDWIADADVYIQNLWLDWNFHWVQWDSTIPSGDYRLPNFPTASPLRRIDEDGLVLNQGTSSGRPVPFLAWPIFRAAYERTARRSSSSPSAWSCDPAGVVKLSHTLSANTPFRFEYWRQTTRMDGDGDYSPIPYGMDRIIIVRAKLIYAEREDAPEITAGASAEYQDLLEKLESMCLPDQRQSRTSQNRGAAFNGPSFE